MVEFVWSLLETYENGYRAIKLLLTVMYLPQTNLPCYSHDSASWGVHSSLPLSLCPSPPLLFPLPFPLLSPSSPPLSSLSSLCVGHFYSGDCYVFLCRYEYPSEEKEDCEEKGELCR